MGTFTMLLVKGSSETELFMHLSNHVFGVLNFGNTKAMRVIFCFKTFKVSARLQKSSKKFRKTFCFWDNCIWIGIAKLSLLRKNTFDPYPMCYQAVPRFFMSIRGTFSDSMDLAVMNEYNKRDVMQICTVLWHFCHVACQKVL